MLNGNLFLPEDLITPGNHHHFDKLFARDNTKGIKAWKVRITHLVGATEIVAEWGKFNGKQQVKSTRITEGKNIGKANQTTTWTQAYSEAESMLEHKRQRDGYYSLADLGITKVDIGYVTADGREHYDLYKVLEQYLPKTGTTVENFIKPMLAKQYWKKTKDTIIPAMQFPCFVQPKYNGVRCTVQYKEKEIKLMSREGVRYRIHHIEFQFAAWYLAHPNFQDVIFDGELYIEKTILAEIVSAVKKPNLLTLQVKFYCFDMVNHEPQHKRLIALKDMDFGTALYPDLIVVKTMVALNNTAESWLNECINLGHEGAIFRSFTGKYEAGKRSSFMVKYKRKTSGEFMILGVIDSQRDPGLAIFVCRNDINHSTFEVVPQGNNAQRSAYFERRNELINKLLTVEYYERTAAPANLPFHATGIIVRDYE